MTKLAWDQIGEREYETGVDHGVLYPQNSSDGSYPLGVAWNGLTSVNEAPSGAAATPQYADNIKYLNLVSIEEFGGTIDAFTYPDEFAACDGTASPSAGIFVGQQNRQGFGLAYRTLKGNDILSTDFGYKLHLVYGALAKPSQKAYATVNDTPAALSFSWEFTTTPVIVPGLKPSATLVIDSNLVDAARLADLEQIIYGSDGEDPRLPLPEEVIALFGTTPPTSITPAKPSNSGNVITIPAVTGAQYKLNGRNVAAGVLPAITADAVVTVLPLPGYIFPDAYVGVWEYIHS